MDLGRSIGHYRLDRVLGIGSFATVWLAHDEVIDRHVAIKVLADNWSRDLDVRRRFLSEARVLLTADSPRITRAFELGETTDGHPYLVMTWADRGTLAERIASRHKAGKFFTGVEAASIVREVALALADVHALGHLHRDVKPSNVLIRSSSGSEAVAGLAPDEQLMLGDFGLARGLDASAITLVAGSPGYVAPEQARGLEQLDVRADLYSLGRIVLELLIGDPGGHATTMSAAASEHVDVPATLADHGVVAPLGLIALTGELLSFEREHRPADAPDVAERLEPLIEYGESAPLRSVTALGARTKRRAGRRTVVATAVVFVLTLVAVLALLLRDRGSPEDAADTTSSAVVSLDLPENAALDEAASDATRMVATISLTVDEVVAFYSDPPAPWEVVEAPTTSGDTTRMVLAAPTRRATVTVTPAAVTAGPGISRIVIDYE